MKNNVNRPLIWLEEFKNSWLSQYIPNDIDLVESIKTKLLELEQIIIGKIKIFSCSNINFYLCYQ